MRKNRLAILLLVIIVVMSFVLASCNNAVPPTLSIRWEDEEEMTYDISLTKFTAESSVSHKVNATDETFFFNYQLYPETPAPDEIMPSSVDGTYTTKITTSADKKTQTYETVQDVVCSYDVSEMGADLFAKITAFVAGLTAADSNLVVSKSSTLVELRSVTETSVTFNNNAKLKPISSYKKVVGYYVGIRNSEVTKVETTTTYDGKTAPINNEKVNLASSEYIDVNQVALYQRGLNQTSAFAATPSVSVFNPLDKRMLTIGFSMTPTAKVLLNNVGTLIYAQTNQVLAYTTVDSSSYPLFVYYNNPNDTMVTDTDPAYNKFTPVKWQSGYFVYEQPSYTEKQVGELTYKPAE